MHARTSCFASFSALCPLVFLRLACSEITSIALLVFANAKTVLANCFEGDEAVVPFVAAAAAEEEADGAKDVDDGGCGVTRLLAVLLLLRVTQLDPLGGARVP